MRRENDPPHSDKLESHKGLQARQLICKAGAHQLLLLPYSPDLNPIGLRRRNGPPNLSLILLILAKFKTLIRKADERTIETIWRKIRTLLDVFTPED